MQNELPAPVAPNEDVCKSERHFSVHAPVGPPQVLHAGHEGCIAVDGHFHVLVLDVLGLDRLLVSPVDAVEHRYIVLALHNMAVHGLDVKFRCVEALEESHVAIDARRRPLIVER